ncbi:hypothetical protein GQ53DRAFT_865152 [Thozetella sp. PMI_491]|nr:hypothetical protein GQ53DRAFT_865152 [Thozetella sp. PMI_491]
MGDDGDEGDGYRDTPALPFDQHSPQPRSWSPPRAQAPTDQQQAPPTINRKKGTACNRCRSQKIRCDNGQDTCTNCTKAGHACIRPNLGNSSVSADYVQQLEARLRQLEHSFPAQRAQPDESENVPALDGPLDPAPAGPDTATFTTNWSPPASAAALPAAWQILDQPVDPDSADVVGTAAPPLHHASIGAKNVDHAIASPATTVQITSSEPLAHDVGLLSLANSKDSKYLGPSSGVPFARLILSAIPQSQGLSTNLSTPGEGVPHQHEQPKPFPSGWTFEVDLKYFFDAYFETYQPFYPFLDEDTVVSRLSAVLDGDAPALHSLRMPQVANFEKVFSPMQLVQMFLIIALGARILEPRLSVDFASERYLATAMARIDRIALHDTTEGLQVMLLLTLCSFHFVDGPNAWFLVSNIIAACLDLGLQRKWRGDDENDLTPVAKNVRRGVFWSAYSLERMLAVVLGRPLTLRDEALDVEFPGADNAGSRDEATPDGDTEPRRSAKRIRMDSSRYTASQYSFRFDQLTAETKLMLYRVQNAPGRFPWLADVSQWRADAHKHCDAIVSDMHRDLKWSSLRSASDSSTRHLELKYHQCLMLLHRPAPASPHPTLESWKVCYSSAVRIILIAADLNRFSKLNSTWPTAHTIFVSAMTFLYCLWVKPEIKQDTTLDSFNRTVAACTGILSFLDRTWSVAASALEKFESLVQLTLGSWRVAVGNADPQQQEGPLRQNPQDLSHEELAAGHSLVSMNQRSSGGQNVPLLDFEQDGVDLQVGSAGADGTSGNDCQLEPQFFFDELGDVSTWFDLDWMMTNGQGDFGLYG